MPATPQHLLRHLRQLVARPTSDLAADGSLLERFVQRRDEDSFAALVERHGTMVQHVCRRLLGDAHAAEDCLQATFLVLAQRAASIRPREHLAAWLHGVARRVALKARATARRRPLQPLPSAELSPADPCPDPLARLTARELLEALDEEVQRLPEVYRLPVLYCCLEGLSQEEAAKRLGWTPGSVKGRLERGRKRLHERLTRRGLTLTVALGAVELARAASAGKPALATATAVLGCAAGKFGAGTGLRLETVMLAKEAVPGVALGKWLLVAAVALVCAAASLVFLPAPAAPLADEGPRPPGAPAQANPAVGKRQTVDLHGDPLPPGAVARLGSIQLRHAGGTVVKFLDDKTLISIGVDRSLRFWDVASGRLSRQLPAPDWGRYGESRIGKVDGSLLALWQTRPSRLSLWDLESGKQLRAFPWKSAEQDVSRGFLLLAPDGRTLAVVTRGEGIQGEPTLHLLDAVTGQGQLPPRKLSNSYRAIAFAPDGKVLAVGSDRSIVLYEVATGRALRQIKGEVYTGLAFAPDGRTLASIDFDDRVSLWDPATGTAQGQLSPPPKNCYGEMPCLAFSHNGRVLAAGGNGRPVALWDVTTRKELHRLLVGRVHRVVFAPGGKVLATSAFGAIRLWDVATGRELHPGEGHTGDVDALAFSPDGSTMASGSFYDCSVRLWDAASGRQRRLLGHHDLGVRSVGFGPEGRTLMSAGDDGMIRLWDTATGKQLKTFSLNDPRKEDTQQVAVARLSTDGKTIAALGDSEVGSTLWAWEVTTGKVLVRRAIAADRFLSCFSVDAKRIAGGNFVEDVHGGKRWGVRVSGHTVSARAFAPDGQTVAVVRVDHTAGGPKAATAVWDLAEDRPAVTLPTEWFRCAAFAPDGRYLATPGRDALRLWELASGQEVFRLPWPETLCQGPAHYDTFATSLAFAPDGRSVATGLLDTTVLVWSLAPDRAAAEEWSPQTLRRLWDDLRGADGRRAYAAIWRLAQGPHEPVLTLLREKVAPAKGLDRARVRQLQADLGSAHFAVRQAATRELGGLGEDLRPLLRQALAAGPVLEVRQRLQKLLAVPAVLPVGERLRQLRAVEVLERMRTAGARRLLERLAGGAAEARVTREARTALERLSKAARAGAATRELE